MSIEAMKQARAFIDDVFQGEWNGSHDRDSILAKLDAAIDAAMQTKVNTNDNTDTNQS